MNAFCHSNLLNIDFYSLSSTNANQTVFYNYSYIMNSKIILILTLSFIFVHSLTPTYLDQSLFHEISTSMDHTHHYIIHSNFVTSDLEEHFNHYTATDHVKLYQCKPEEDATICQKDKPLILIINTIQIKFNGNLEKEDDIKKWIQYRIDEHPNRLTSMEELQEYTREKFQVFCFVDNTKQETQVKEYIFVALAKKIHFLYFCLIDKEVVSELNLTSGHLALIRRNMTVDVDEKSEEMAHDDTNMLFQTWQHFVINTFVSDMRIDNKNVKANSVILECDMSLDCEDDMSILMMTEKIWRNHHPQLNYKVNIHEGIDGLVTIGEEEYRYPIYRFVKKELKERFGQKEGKTVKFIDITKIQYISEDSSIKQNSISSLLELVQKSKLKQIGRSFETIEQSVPEVQVAQPRPAATQEEADEFEDL